MPFMWAKHILHAPLMSVQKRLPKITATFLLRQCNTNLHLTGSSKSCSSVAALQKDKASQNSDIRDQKSKQLPNLKDGYVVFHKPSKFVFDVPLIQQDNKDVMPDVSLHFKASRQILHIPSAKQHKVEELIDKDDVDLKSIAERNWRPMVIDYKNLPPDYAKLSKSRLTGLVVVTAMAGYAIAPGVFSLATFAGVALGTGLTSAAANAVNQFFEVPYDSQMNRTKNRPIVRGAISPLHAVGFAAVTATTGVSILLATTNPITAALGVCNLLLYTAVYTPMKRTSITNTWIGSIVGAVPPIMGWVASSGQIDAGAWLLAGLMYAWQFPHFNALSWNLRPEYSRAGYRMMAVTHPQLTKRVTLRYSVAMVVLCQLLAPLMDVTTWTYAVDSLPFNAYMVYLSWRFYRNSDSNSSRKLFRFSLIHLPAVMMLMLISKKQYFGGNKMQPTGILVPV